MTTTLKIAVSVAALSLFASAANANPTFSPKPRETAQHAMDVSLTPQCKVLATLSCDLKDSHLGKFSPVTKTAAVKSLSTASAHCIDPATGAFKGTGAGAEVVTAIMFTSNGRFGYDQKTVTCEQSDGSTKQHRLTVSVAKD